jgi:acetolactate synthase-1/2/3 large subunit
MKMNGAEIVIRILEAHGVDCVTGIPGGANLPLYDAIYKREMRHVLARHEQGAGFIAQGMARSTGKPAVCIATSGPGATNVITAIADARMDSVPLIVITGQVPSALMGSDAFQEVDVYQMTISIVKHNFIARKPEELLRIIPDAFAIASAGRPGPVLIDIPRDVQLGEIDCEIAAPVVTSPHIKNFERELEESLRIINGSERPVIYAGGGMNTPEGAAALFALAHAGRIPVTLTLSGLGAFPPDDELFLGMIGMHGTPTANMAIDRSDCVIALGVRFDDRAIGRLDSFAKHAAIIHADIDRVELDKIKKCAVSVECDAADFSDRLSARMEKKDSVWITSLRSHRDEYAYPAGDPGQRDHPANIIREIGRMLPQGTIVTTDVGQHQMWCAQVLQIRRPRSFLTSGGLGTMGFGLPAAVGASLANPGTPVACVSGDGSILMNIQELATLADLGLPVKIFVMNNRHLGLVRQQQELFYGKRYSACRFETIVDYAKAAESFGIRGVTVDSIDDSMELIREALRDDKPVLFDIRTASDENVLPMVPPGEANINMLGDGYSRLS